MGSLGFSIIMDLQRHAERSSGKARENRKFLNSLKNENAAKVDAAFHRVHDEVFGEIECLACANCCKTTSPIFYQNDIERLAASLRIKPGDFIERYLHIDDDNDYVLRSTPCPFLDEENHCTVYEERPRACREYPHTRRKKMFQLTELTYRNTLVCPAVFEIVERLRKVSLG